MIVIQNLVSWYCNKSVEHHAPASLGGRGLDGEGCQLLAGGGRGEAGSDPHGRQPRLLLEAGRRDAALQRPDALHAAPAAPEQEAVLHQSEVSTVVT